jgi:MFS family permease
MVQSGWAIGYILAATLATLIIPSFKLNQGWRILFFVGIIPAFLVFYIRRYLSEPEVWKKTARMRKEGKLSQKSHGFTLGQIFIRDLIRYTITATVLSSLCMIAYWGFYFWIPQFLSKPVSQGGVGLGPKEFAWIIPINIGALIGCNTLDG